jgi:hypothetical protein
MWGLAGLLVNQSSACRCSSRRTSRSRRSSSGGAGGVSEHLPEMRVIGSLEVLDDQDGIIHCPVSIDDRGASYARHMIATRSSARMAMPRSISSSWIFQATFSPYGIRRPDWLRLNAPGWNSDREVAGSWAKDSCYEAVLIDQVPRVVVAAEDRMAVDDTVEDLGARCYGAKLPPTAGVVESPLMGCPGIARSRPIRSERVRNGRRRDARRDGGRRHAWVGLGNSQRPTEQP